MGVNTYVEKILQTGQFTTDGKDVLEKNKINLFALNEKIIRRLKEIGMDNTFSSHQEIKKFLDDGIEQDYDFQTPKFSIGFIDKRKYFSKIQKWVGHIIDFNDEVITAKLNDINNPTTYEIAEFDVDEVPPEDREFISNGAGFYWSLGQVNDNGQIEKKSLIRFQRTKPWEESDINEIIDSADELYHKLNNWE